MIESPRATTTLLTGSGRSLPLPPQAAIDSATSAASSIAQIFLIKTPLNVYFSAFAANLRNANRVAINLIVACGNSLKYINLRKFKMQAVEREKLCQILKFNANSKANFVRFATRLRSLVQSS